MKRNAAAVILLATGLLASCASSPDEMTSVSDPFLHANQPSPQADSQVEHAEHSELVELPGSEQPAEQTAQVHQ